jgi:uncharacterized protein with PIN domain
VHLGKLARWLRLLGFDTGYENFLTNAELVAIAKHERRILLSRNAIFKKLDNVFSFIIESEDPWQQLKQVTEHFQLKNKLRSFSRCIICNGSLEAVSKEQIKDQLEENTAAYLMSSGNAKIASVFIGRARIMIEWCAW